MPKFLELKGHRLACNDVMPVGLFFDLAEALDESDETGPGMIKAVSAMSKTLKAIVAPEEQKRLRDILHDPKDPISLDDLNTALGKVIPEYTQRPTPPPSSSPTGPEPTGGTARRAFHWGAEATGKTSGKAGARPAS